MSKKKKIKYYKLRLRTRSAISLFEKPIGKNKYPLGLALINKLRRVNYKSFSEITSELEELSIYLNDLKKQYENIVKKRSNQAIKSMGYIKTKRLILGGTKSRAVYLAINILKTYDDVLALLILVKECGGLDVPRSFFEIRHEIQQNIFKMIFRLVWLKSEEKS